MKCREAGIFRLPSFDIITTAHIHKNTFFRRQPFKFFAQFIYQILKLNIMKTKSLFLFTCMPVLSMLVALSSYAQQPKYSAPIKPIPAEMANEQVTDNYTYHVFTSPNKTFGYDIFQNERLVFCLPAMPRFKGDEKGFLTKKQQAEKAVALTIRKLKNGIPPALTPAEVRRITAE
jgi:hypothetical protein